MQKIVNTFLFLLFFSSCSMAQPTKYGSSNKKAVKFYEKARDCFSNIDAITGKRDLDCAEENLQKAIDKDPSFAQAFNQLSIVYIEKNDFEKAIEYKQMMFATGKKIPDYEFFYLASMQMAIGDYANCEKNAQRYLQIRNGNETFIAQCHKYVDDCQFAKKAIKKPVPYDPINLGANVNSDRPEYFPSLTADDQTLLYTRLINDNNALYGRRVQEDIFISTKEITNWKIGESIGAPINTIYNEGAPTFSADGKYVIMVGCEIGNKGDYDYGADRKGYGSCDLFVSEKIGNEWTKPNNIGAPVNSKHWETQPSFSSDGKTLYFIRGVTKSGDPRNDKDQDIYKTEILPNGSWSKPEKLGPNINTSGREESVQIHPDGQSLYFASDGFPGMGGVDLYVSRMEPDGTWGKAVNLGYPINTHKDENSLLVSSKGDIALFASDREGGFGDLDLYSFDMPPSVQPIQTTFVKGIVYDSLTKSPLAADFQLIDLSTGKLFKRAIANSGNGEFIVALPKNKDFALIAEHEGYFFYSKNYALDALQKEEDGYTIKVPMRPLEGTFVLENIFFDVDKSLLKKESVAELEKLKNILIQHTNLKAELAGHTDNDGDNDHNQILSEERAKAVMDWLVSSGIDKGRLSFRGYGETQPIVPNDSAQNKAKNRRTEVTIFK